MQDRDHGTGMSYEELLARSKKMKKRVITVVAAILAAMLLLFAAVWGLSVLLQKTKKPPQFDYEFYPTYEGDIMEYPAYLELQRDILYAESFDGMGYTTSITDENRDSFDEYVLFLCDYLQTIIAGDADAYNGFFSDGYLKEYGRQEAFPPQMLYDMRIGFYSREGDGASARVTYQLDYRIFQNDGKFRDDVDSDAIRPQYAVVTRDGEGNLVIDLLVTRYENRK